MRFHLLLSAWLCTASLHADDLISAAYRDDLIAVRALLDSGAAANTTNTYGVDALSTACRNGNAEMVKILLTAGADPHLKQAGGETALMIASRTGNLDSVKALLAAKADPSATENKGQTAIMWAAAEGHLETVEALLEAGADFKTTLRSGFTPLLFAVRAGHTSVVQILLKAGAGVDDTAEGRRGGGHYMRKGTSPLMLAVENGHLDLALELVDAGADPNDLRSGFAPLHAISWVRKTQKGDGPNGVPPPEISGKTDSLDFVRELVARGANTDLPLTRGGGGARLNLKGATPLLMAAATCDLPLIKLLIQLGADPKTTNSRGTTPLIAAAGVGAVAPGEEAATENESLETAAYFLDLGADINAVNSAGETAMHGAAYRAVPKVMRLLDERGADIAIWNTKNSHGWTPLLISQGFRFGNFRPITESTDAISEIMEKHGVNVPPPPTRKP